MRRGIHRTVTLALAAAAGAGCSDGAQDRAAAGASPRWTLAPTPSVAIGDERGGPATFERIAGVRTDGRGRIVVVDAGAAEVRVFDRDGVHLATHGGRGDGPGELRRPRLLGILRGDSVALSDRGALTTLGPDGAHGRTHPLRTPDMPLPLQALAALPDGRVVVQTVQLFPGAHGAGDVLSDTITLSVLDPVTGGLQSLGATVAPAWVWTGDDQVPLPFAPSFSASAADRGVVALGDGGSAVLRFRPGGGAPETWPSPRPPAPVSAEDREAYRRSLEARGLSGPRLEAWASALDHPAVPTHAPAYDRVVATAEGGAWARRGGGREGARVWDVFSSEGDARGVVHTPESFQVEEVRDGRALGIWRDSLGVETVRAYTVEGGPAAGTG